MNKLMILIAALFLTANAAVAQTSPVIGIINLEQALFNTDAARQLEEGTRAEFGNDERRLEQLSTELRAIIERAQRDESIMSESEMRALNSEAEEKQVQMRLISERLQGAWQQRQQQFIDSMRERLGQAIESVVQEGNYDLVLNAESVAFFNNSYNITALVTAKLNELSR
ncbi:MAG: OmpH family outer membrane protein [Pseudohongiella sp.]|nr:OmpH family outer membrane protein [Pseudohongiella sp.]MDO9519189.1 OmpH family outer membrane protein [Pseudohongiella sp.]MDP2128750.1 OmpH family outer membrane protein [Pseudohongiella sp.]